MRVFAFEQQKTPAKAFRQRQVYFNLRASLVRTTAGKNVRFAAFCSANLVPVLPPVLLRRTAATARKVSFVTVSVTASGNGRKKSSLELKKAKYRAATKNVLFVERRRFKDAFYGRKASLISVTSSSNMPTTSKRTGAPYSLFFANQ